MDDFSSLSKIKTLFPQEFKKSIQPEIIPFLQMGFTEAASEEIVKSKGEYFLHQSPVYWAKILFESFQEPLHPQSRESYLQFGLTEEYVDRILMIFGSFLSSQAAAYWASSYCGFVHCSKVFPTDNFSLLDWANKEIYPEGVKGKRFKELVTKFPYLNKDFRELPILTKLY